MNKKAILFSILWLILIILIQTRNLDIEKQKYIYSIDEVKKTTEKDIQNFARYEARNMAEAIWICIKNNIEEKWINEIGDMLPIISNCWAQHRSWWPTWDFFVFDRISKLMIFDNSPDCAKLWDFRDFTYEWECSIHKDKIACWNAIKDLYNVWNSTRFDKIYWQFDDSIEWLESYVIPSLTKWFNWNTGEFWVIDKNNIQLEIVMWTQTDEVYKNFENSRDIFYKNKEHWLNYVNWIYITYIFLVILVCVLSIFTAITIKLKKE